MDDNIVEEQICYNGLIAWLNSGEFSWSLPFVMLMTSFFISGNTFQPVSWRTVILWRNSVWMLLTRFFTSAVSVCLSVQFVWKFKVDQWFIDRPCSGIWLRFRWLVLLVKRFKISNYLFYNFFDYYYKIVTLFKSSKKFLLGCLIRMQRRASFIAPLSKMQITIRVQE